MSDSDDVNKVRLDLFEEIQKRDSQTIYQFGDWPFVGSVYLTPSDDGFLSDWVITGVRKSDSLPKFMLRIVTGISSSQADVIPDCSNLWMENIQELAFHAAMQGGQDLPVNSLPNDMKKELANFHLFAHDRFGDFMQESATVTERTARMFHLIKSMGFVQAQKLITEYEVSNSTGKVKPSTVAKRLHMAREAGLIPYLSADNSFEYQKK